MTGVAPVVPNECSSELASEDNGDGVSNLTRHRVQAALEREAARERLQGCGLSNAYRAILQRVAESSV
jgi:hypothetical protein